MSIKPFLSKTPICLCFKNTEKQSNLMNMRNRTSEQNKKDNLKAYFMRAKVIHACPQERIHL